VLLHMIISEVDIVRAMAVDNETGWRGHRHALAIEASVAYWWGCVYEFLCIYIYFFIVTWKHYWFSL
jgi:hypothetical protein